MKRITICINEDERFQGALLYSALLDHLSRGGVKAVTILRAQEALDASGQVQTTRILRLAEHLPLRIEFIETAERTAALLAEIDSMMTNGTIILADVDVVSKDSAQRE